MIISIHPLVVHFPIALFATAVVCDSIYLLLYPRAWLDRASLLMYLFASVGAVLAAVTGKIAQQKIVGLEPQVMLEVMQHGDWAFGTVIAFVLVTCLRFDIHWQAHRKSGSSRRILVMLVAGVALVLLWQTATTGGFLVFHRGVGIIADEDRKEIHRKE